MKDDGLVQGFAIWKKGSCNSWWYLALNMVTFLIYMYGDDNCTISYEREIIVDIDQNFFLANNAISHKHISFESFY